MTYIAHLKLLLFFLPPTAFSANSQIAADVFEWSCPEKLFQYLGEDCTKGWEDLTWGVWGINCTDRLFIFIITFGVSGFQCLNSNLVFFRAFCVGKSSFYVYRFFVCVRVWMWSLWAIRTCFLSSCCSVVAVSCLTAKPIGLACSIITGLQRTDQDCIFFFHPSVVCIFLVNTF